MGFGLGCHPWTRAAVRGNSAGLPQLAPAGGADTMEEEEEEEEDLHSILAVVGDSRRVESRRVAHWGQ